MSIATEIGTVGRAARSARPNATEPIPLPLQRTLEHEKDLLQRVFTIPTTARFDRLKKLFLDAEPVIEIDRDRIYTRVMRATDGEAMVIRRAKAFAAVVREMPVRISPDELLVGHVNVTWLGHRITAESPDHMEALLRYAKRRRSVISEADEREMRDDLLPYWRQRSVRHWGHLTINLQKVLAKGFIGVKLEAEERLARLDRSDPDELRKIPFLQAVIIAMQASAEIGARFATEARRRADAEAAPVRGDELRRIAAICDRVPANPARDCRDAIQSPWVAYILLFWEVMSTEGYSVGRPDQYLQSFYERDIAAGRISREEVQEMLDCWLLRLNIPDFTVEDIGERRGFSSSPGAHLSVGGYRPDGRDGTNELSFMMREAAMHAGLPGPHMSLQVHSRTPEDLLVKACQLCALGYGQPEFENADVIVPGIMMRDAGVNRITMEDARGFASVGCQEPMTVGTEGLNPSGMINATLAMDLALNNGRSRITGEQLGPESGDPRPFASFEAVLSA